MGLLKELGQRAATEIGEELYQFAAELFPICQSIMGDGIQRTLALIQEKIPLRTVGECVSEYWHDHVKRE
jgi:aminopeptidase-like protein